MASKKAKQKKVLDKAKQLVLKNKKGKAKAKPKQSYPEGQNAPQSKAYRIDNDKTQVAKATGYRFTTEGAKRLGKTESDRPTQAEVEKYRNQTFKVKGKVNKSGPKGTGDGSFRYIYIERRADKADLKRNQKLAHGGSIDDKRERVIDYYLNNDVFDDYDTYGLTEQDLMDAKKSKSYKKIEDAIVKYHGLDDDENVEERFEVLGLGDDDEYAKGGKVKEFEIDDDETGKTLIFKARSYEEALEIADKTDFNDFEDGVVVDVLIYNDDEYAKGGKTKNLPTKQEFREFQEYVFFFYGKDGIYEQTDYFEGGATTEEILLATNQYVTFCAKNPDLWGGGDSTDREIVRDIMLYHRGEKIDGLEHGDYIKRMKKTTILEYGGILQPMIGGVNADPRFDIYNTTMFAEDGAMLELGGENPDEKLKVTIHVDVYEDDYEEGEGKRVHGYTVDWLKNETIKADDLLNFLGRELGLSNEPNDYTIDDDGYIHTSRLEDSEGLEASQDEIDLWKLGGKKLYSAQYTIIPEAVGQSRKPSQSELHVVTDIPMYEDGGEMAKGGKLKVGGDDFSFLLELSDKELSKRLDLVRKQQAINSNQYFEAKEKGNSTSNIEESGKRLQNQETAIIQARTKKMADGGMMAKGGKTHEQGYDDREDESLAMRHGKIATKDFVGSHKRREHSRRDDAQFETRNKK